MVTKLEKTSNLNCECLRPDVQIQGDCTPPIIEVDSLDNGLSYDNLLNKPKINGEVLKGDKTGDDLGLVDKTTEPNKVYGTDDEGKPTTIPYSKEFDPNYIVQRDGNGDVIVPSEPSSDYSATSKKYVDESIDAALEEATVFKGVVDNQTLLPTSGNRNGDMYWIREFVEPVPEGMIAGHSGTAIFNGTLQEFQFESDEIYDPDLKSIIFDNENKLAVQLSNQEDNIIQFTENGLYASTTGLEQELQNEIERATAAEEQLQSNIDTEATTRQTADETLQSNIEAETTRATTAEGQLNTKIEAETTRAEGVEGTLTSLTTDSKTNLVSAINEVDSHTDTNTSNIGTMTSLTTDEKSTLVGAINEVDSHTDTNTSNIGTLSSLTTTAKDNLVNAINELDSTKQDNITGAATTITDNNLTANRVLISDANGKVAADANVTTTELSYIDGTTSNIQQQIGTLNSLTTDAKTSLQAAINEVDSHADTANTNIGTMNSLTTDAKNNLVSAINEVDSHTDTNTTSIGTLSSLSTDAKTNLVSAINEVDSHTDLNTTNITNIQALIPGEATSSNQLADKDFVNSSIATQTGNFIGTFPNIPARDAYVGDVTNNDYCFVINSVITDNGNDWNTFADLDAYNKNLVTNFDYAWVIDGSKFDLYRFDVVNQVWEKKAEDVTKEEITLNNAYNRYKAVVEDNVLTWEYEYTLNNSSFTASQWAAINSGATTEKINQITTNENAIGPLTSLTTTAKDNLVNAINELNTNKQENLSEGTGIDITNNTVSLDADLNDLNDVEITSAQNENFLLFNSTLAKWVNYALTEIDGGHAGTIPPTPPVTDNPNGGDSSTNSFTNTLNGGDSTNF